MKTIEVHGHQFDIVKYNGEWQTQYKGAKATGHKLQAEAIKQLQAMPKDKVIYALERHDEGIAKTEYIKANAERFKEVFGFPIPLDRFMRILTGHETLDVFELDRRLHTPDGISTEDYITQQFGQDTCDMVFKML